MNTDWFSLFLIDMLYLKLCELAQFIGKIEDLQRNVRAEIPGKCS